MSPGSTNFRPPTKGGIGWGFSNWHAHRYLGPEIHPTGLADDHHEFVAMVAPRTFLLIGGNSADRDKSTPFPQAARPVYQLYGEQPPLGLWNHRQEPSVPKEVLNRIAEWFDAYLKDLTRRYN